VFTAMMRLMRIEDLTPEQLRAGAARAAEFRDWLGRLERRMRELRFPTDDKLTEAVIRAYEGASGLSVTAASAATKLEQMSPMMKRKPWAGG
jgi:hypothetical protein